jgi:hypothetical protein
MATFPVKSANQIADFMIPVTPEMAAEIAAKANAANDGTVSAAVYYTGPNGKRTAILLSLFLEFDVPDVFGFLYTDEYHPRKNGKADLTYQTDYVMSD